MDNIFQPSQVKRTLFFILCDSLIIVFSLYFAFLIRFEFAIPSLYESMFVWALPFFLLLKLIIFSLFGLYRITWRYVGVNELYLIYVSSAVAASILMIMILIPYEPRLSGWPLPFIQGFPRSIFFVDALVCSVLLSGLRLSKRLYLEKFVPMRGHKKGLKTLIVGAGNTGEMVLRDICQRGCADFCPVGFLDDDPTKVGGYIRGVKVLGAVHNLRQAIRQRTVQGLIVAIPSLDHKSLKNIYSVARDCGVQTIKIVPRIYDFHRPEISLKNLEEIGIEDLIGRQTVRINQDAINDFINNKSVLVTGAGGSIGSEIVMQVCSFQPSNITLFDIDETELHHVLLRMKRAIPHIEERCHFMVGDIRDSNRVQEIFAAFRPDIVFHAAAYKHVPMMESNAKEAIKVNIFGTYIVAEAAVNHGCARFILISTDKAIKPTSIMGASKRIAESICHAFNGACDNTDFVSVRFGNVLGSRGSVLPLFLDQLKHGGPITITHPEMRRYFMTIPEAVSLVLQASVIGGGGEVLVLDMGDPVTIVALAEELIRLHGMKPYVDIDITYTGCRPGEKLFEEMLTAEEGAIATMHEKIFIAKNNHNGDMSHIQRLMDRLDAIVRESPIKESSSLSKCLNEFIASL
ncbi:MAG: polysaccharide biosynthesis protein [Syntrophobacteraceae bacterium]